jgi:hypothetical protein
MRRLRGFPVIVVALGLVLPVKAQTPDMTGGTIRERTLGKLISDSDRIVILKVDKLDEKERIVSFKQGTVLKGKKEEFPIQHEIDGFLDDRCRKEYLDWAKSGAKAVCFSQGNSAMWTCLGNSWYYGSANDPPLWLTSTTANGLGVAYLGSVEKLADHVIAILAGREVTVTAQVPGHDDRSLYDESPIIRNWYWGQKGRIWRIKASLKIQDVEDKANEKAAHFVGWGVAGSEAVPGLVKSLTAKEARVRAEAAEDLGQIRPAPLSAVPALRQALDDPDMHVRIYAAGSLYRIQPGNKDTLPILIAGLDNKDEMIRAEAAGSLANSRDAGASGISALFSSLQDDKNEYVRSMAAYALGQVGPGLTEAGERRADALAALVKASEQDKSEKVRFWAARALKKFAPLEPNEGVSALKKAPSGEKNKGVDAIPSLQIKESTLEQLLSDYRKYGLPLPPKDAKLMFVKSEDSDADVFWLRAGNKTLPTTILRGLHSREVKVELESDGQTISPDQEKLEGLDLDTGQTVVLAAQCHAQGYAKLARHLLKGLDKNEERSLRTALAEAGWIYRVVSLRRPDADWTEIEKNLKAIYDLGQVEEKQNKRDFLKKLALTLAPSLAKPGSIEALIDDLSGKKPLKAKTFEGLTLEEEALQFVISNLLGSQTIPKEPGSEYDRLAHRGFEAVPVLIDHLEDERLTRFTSDWFNNFWPYQLQIKHVVSELLQGLAGNDLGTTRFDTLKGFAVTKEAAQAWWAEAQKVGEEKYFLGHVLPGSDEQGHYPHSLLLRLTRDKYPKNLVPLYTTVLEKRPKIASKEVVEAIVESSLAIKTKKDLVLNGSKHSNLNLRWPALWGLKQLDKEQYLPLLLDTLDHLPSDSKGDYWKCAEKEFATLVAETDDPKAWQALNKAAKRSAVGLRMEIINGIADHSNEKTLHDFGLHFLAGFLDDETVRDSRIEKAKFEGPYAGFKFSPSLSVRDLAAKELGRIMKFSPEPEPTWEPEKWSKYRHEVRAKLEKKEH